MKPQLLKVSKDLVCSFSARRDIRPNVNNMWHYHAEVELVYFKKGKGTQFIGDSISEFQDGDVVLVGSNLPHYWKFDDCYFDDHGNDAADVCVMHFNENFWGDTFLTLPETNGFRMTLEKSKQGIQISDEAKKVVGDLMEQAIWSVGARKIILLMEILLAIGECGQSKVLASIAYHHNFHDSEKERINAIYNYSISNFQKKITLEEIASVANISQNSFCKFFKAKNRKTYTQFINEIRVGHACKLLIDNRLSVKEVCYESGFYNLASFYKYFKQVTAKNPLSYQRNFVSSNKYSS